MLVWKTSSSDGERRRKTRIYTAKQTRDERSAPPSCERKAASTSQLLLAVRGTMQVLPGARRGLPLVRATDRVRGSSRCLRAQGEGWLAGRPGIEFWTGPVDNTPVKPNQS